MREAVAGFGTHARGSSSSPEMSFSMRMASHRPPALNESRQQSADADELDVQPALICERGGGVEVCPWGVTHEAEFET